MKKKLPSTALHQIGNEIWLILPTTPMMHRFYNIKHNEYFKNLKLSKFVYLRSLKREMVNNGLWNIILNKLIQKPDNIIAVEGDIPDFLKCYPPLTKENRDWMDSTYPDIYAEVQEGDYFLVFNGQGQLPVPFCQLKGEKLTDAPTRLLDGAYYSLRKETRVRICSQDDCVVIKKMIQLQNSK